MKNFFAAIAFSLLLIGACAEPCVDANVSPESDTQHDLDMLHLEEDGR